MKVSRSTAVGTAVALLITGASAQAADAPASNEVVQEVVVTGIRASIQDSLDIKQKATGLTEVVSAEDIGKLPDKNVADALQRLPGVNVSSAAAGEGGFDENDRISIRGTSPSLTQTTVNGHPVATGDWFILDQFQTVGRSVSYTLLPSEIVSHVVVDKSQRADLLEGGVSGSVDIQTRKPLDLKQPLTIEVQLAGERSDLAAQSSPQADGLIAWKNDAGNFGILAQAFYEKRVSRRDGQEFLGYSTIAPTNAAAVAHPDLNGVVYPTLIGAALFDQTREREGGDLDIQLAATDTLSIDLDAFYSRLNASNYNRNYMAWVTNIIGGTVQAAPSSYQVKNGTLVSAAFPVTPGLAPGIVDNIDRPGSYAKTYYTDLNVKLLATSNLTVTAAIGQSFGVGATPTQPAYEGNVGTGTGGLIYSMNGLSAPASVAFPNVDTSNFAGTVTGWAWDETAKVDDSEKYAQLDALIAMDQGVLKSLKFGARYAEHIRSVNFPEDGGLINASILPVWGGATYPGNFGSGLNPPAGFLTGVWQLDPSVIQAYAASNVSHAYPAREYWPGEFRVAEDDSALYGMADLGGDRWTVNAGVRLVGTYESSRVNASLNPNDTAVYAFGSFTQQTINHQYWDVLPSASFKYNIDTGLVARASVARAMARPDYSALGGAVSLTDLTNSGTGGNPNLKPIRSWNYDASLEWYFAPQSLVSLGVFYMDFSSYVDFGLSSAQYLSLKDNRIETYIITSPSNIGATDKGFEVSYQQPIWGGFGVQANYTYADGSTATGGELVGASKTTYNVAGYFENKHLSVQLAYTFRSHFLVGLDRSFAQHEDDIGSLDSTINYSINEHFSLRLDALNLTNAVLKYYANTTDQPRAFYVNGRQYYLGGTYKF